MDEACAFPNKGGGCPGGLHQVSHHLSVCWHIQGIALKILQMGTGLGLPFGSWHALLGEKTSVSPEGERERYPCSPAKQAP